MKTPTHTSYEEFVLKRTEWIKAHCITDGERQLCVRCTTPIEIIGAYLSIHDKRFDHCAGPGHVVRLVVPYCPRCEEQPEARGCLHDDIPVIGLGGLTTEWQIQLNLLRQLLEECDGPQLVLNGSWIRDTADLKQWLRAKIEEAETLGVFFSH
jgi:hypothetical protein